MLIMGQYPTCKCLWLQILDPKIIDPLFFLTLPKSVWFSYRKILPIILSPWPPQQITVGVKKKKTTLSTPHRFRAPRLGVWHPPSWSCFNDLLLLTFVATTAQRDLVNQETEAAGVFNGALCIYVNLYTLYYMDICIYTIVYLILAPWMLFGCDLFLEHWLLKGMFSRVLEYCCWMS